MIKAAVDGLGLAPLAVAGLVLFVVTFLAIAAWTLSRSKNQIETWSSLPLADDDDEPLEPRDTDDQSTGFAEAALQIVSAPRESCGKCEHCTCVPGATHELVAN